MEQRETVVIDDTYYRFDTEADAAVYESESFNHNRADSIWWACRRCEDDPEIRDYLFRLRAQFREQLARDFPNDAALSPILGDEQDPNHFFVLIGKFAEKRHSAGLQEMALFFAEKLKAELNLDLHPSLFKAVRSHSKPPPRRKITIPSKK